MDAKDRMAFLASQNVLRHAGQWVAIINNRVVAAGPSLVKVHERAEKVAKGTRPYYYSVPKASHLY